MRVTGCSGSSPVLCAKRAVLLLGGLNISAEALASLIPVLLSGGLLLRQELRYGWEEALQGNKERQADSTSILKSLSTVLHLNCLERQRWGEL